MLLTKYAHACVRIEDGEKSVLIDPGCWTVPEAFEGVRAVLITHGHADHLDDELLAAARNAAPALQVFAPQDVAAELGDYVRPLTVGERFEAGGFAVRAVGGRHAQVIDNHPDCPNLGYLVEGVYHPGDSLHVPDEEVRALLLPASGPWLTMRGAIEMVRAVRPERTFPIHDANLSEIGMANFDGWLGEEADTRYARIAIGGSAPLD
ncbi:MBL fold metallo-hydrolase [Kitasatospora sp. CB01950]|uniref:MBL fold metallo-hydrolase n=1 Tax=Kitasatospora sp. CB01950 TaxID=1703930 RepID=UPI00093D339A|nr:MBL fold metallo-hydrolase [Kitasatospora sp. CB01950]OKJ05655.1 beta-lactamase [Kitasatospora sp. CB01950]